MEQYNVISVPINRHNTFEKIMSEISEYEKRYGVKPDFVFVDCFSVEFLLLQNKHLKYEHLETSKYVFAGIQIIPIESMVEFISAQTSDHRTLMKISMETINKIKNWMPK